MNKASLKNYINICKKYNMYDIDNLIDNCANYNLSGGELDSIYDLKNTFQEDAKYRLLDIYHSYHEQQQSGGIKIPKGLISSAKKGIKKLSKNKDIKKAVISSFSDNEKIDKTHKSMTQKCTDKKYSELVKIYEQLGSVIKKLC